MQVSEKISAWITPGKLLLVLCLVLLIAIIPVLASSGGPFGLPWWTADGGGGTSSGGNFALSGTIGQADAGGPLHGGDYALTGGFWSDAGPGDWTIYLPVVLR